MDERFDNYGFERFVVKNKVVQGFFVEEKNNLYRVIRRVRDPKDRRRRIPDLSCQDVLTYDEYTHLWLPNVICDAYFRTKPELERISTRVARLEREIEEALGKRIFHDTDAFAPYWGWKDDLSFEFVFNGGVDDDGDEFFYSFECLYFAGDGFSYIFDKMYEDDHHVDATPDFTPEQVKLFKQFLTTLMAYSEGMTCAAAKENGWLL